MVRVIEPDDGRRVPIYLWARTAPAAAVEQLGRIASETYVVGRVAGMPDLHVANGVAVGTVFATDGVVVPAALGGDLGCGVAAVRLKHPEYPLTVQDLRRVLSGWAARIPVGDAVHRGPPAELPAGLLASPLSTRALEHERERRAHKHLGTLGGGNHFVELDRTADGEIWLLVHSGSRGMGAAIGAHHLKAAVAQGQGGLPGLSVHHEAGAGCLRDISWALAFAAANRAVIVTAAAKVVEDVTGLVPEGPDRLDVHHNFVTEEEHLGRKVWVHRKGAIAAPVGARVLIPGSMGTASYVAEGLGEPLAFCSASHGAGRVMTRREARERIGQQRFAHAMRRVVHDERRAAALVEEAPMAYRDIAEVLEDEEDLVRPVLRLEPLVVLKG